MDKKQLDNEVFALRDGEKFTVFESQPSSGRVLAVQLRSCEMPPGARRTVRTRDKVPVEQAAVLACEMERESHGWQWIQLSPATKEALGDVMFDSGCDRDRWYYAIIEQLPADSVAA